MAGKFWTAEEDAILRESWPRITAGQIETASLLRLLPGRTLPAIRNRGFNLGVTGVREKLPADWEVTLRALHAKGWHGPEIAKEMGICSRYCSTLREQLGLQSNAYNDRYREMVASNTKKQLVKSDVKSLAEVRVKRFREFAESHGWPSDLRPRGVQILELLLVAPALNRREICDQIGMRWLGSRHSMKSNDPEGSYLANLMARGLVLQSPRLFTGRTGKRKGCGCSEHVYMASELATQLKESFLKGSRDGTAGDESGSSEQCDQRHQSACQPVAAACSNKTHGRSVGKGR